MPCSIATVPTSSPRSSAASLAPDTHALPPMWHLAFFNSWPAAGNVGPDGHPLRGPLLPALPDRTRMWIGGRWRGAAPLAIGVEATCMSTVSSAVVEHGRSGPMLLATVRHAISQGDVECVVHEQDLAYRSGTATARATQTTPRSPGGSDLLVDDDGRFAFDPVQVFRFSALTRNAHRIHYDADYARTDEGYPGLSRPGAPADLDHARDSANDFERRRRRCSTDSMRPSMSATAATSQAPAPTDRQRRSAWPHATSTRARPPICAGADLNACIRPTVGQAGCPLIDARSTFGRLCSASRTRCARLAMPVGGEYSTSDRVVITERLIGRPGAVGPRFAGGGDLRTFLRSEVLHGFGVSPGVWIVTVVGLLAIVAFDLFVIARRKRTVTSRRDPLGGLLRRLAALFAVGLFCSARGSSGAEFFAGYITEYSLSVDNLFVFVIIMARFAVPPWPQTRCCTSASCCRCVLRAVFIAGGRGGDRGGELGLLHLRRVPDLHRGPAGARGRERRGRLPGERRRCAGCAGSCRSPTTTTAPSWSPGSTGGGSVTPLVIVIAAIGVANVIFALDSIPAIFGLTQDAYIVFTANAFALMGLRQLYFLIGGLLDGSSTSTSACR